MSQPEHDAWVDRLMSGVGNLTATRESLVFAWSEMIMHLGPTEDHKPDVYFIKAARKAAANQVAYANIEKLKPAIHAANLQNARRTLAAEEARLAELDKAKEA